jgi:hypothetical protein
VSAQRGIDLDPGSFYASWVRLLCLALMGRKVDALNSARDLSARFGRHPWILMAVAIAAGVAGDRETAEAVYHEVKGRAGLEYVQRIVIAVAALYAGRVPEAYEHLQAAAAERDALLSALVLDWPGLTPLRQTEQYQRILHAMGWDRPSASPT